MGKRGPTSLETKQHQLKMFLLDIMLSGVLREVDLLKNGEATVPPPIRRHHSARHIKNLYGEACVNLFRICFIQWQRGGRTLEGQAYKSTWRYRSELTPHLLHLNELRQAGSHQTAASWVYHLNEAGFEPLSRYKVWNEDMSAVIEQHIVTQPEIRLLRDLHREHRSHYREVKQRRESLQ